MFPPQLDKIDKLTRFRIDQGRFDPKKGTFGVVVQENGTPHGPTLAATVVDPKVDAGVNVVDRLAEDAKRRGYLWIISAFIWRKRAAEMIYLWLFAGTQLEEIEYLGLDILGGTWGVHHVSLGHADTGVANLEKLVLLVGDDQDVEILLGIEHGRIGERSISDFVESIGTVGDQFTEEDFLVGVEGVWIMNEIVPNLALMMANRKLTDNEIEQLTDLSLESETFGGHLFFFWLRQRERTEGKNGVSVHKIIKKKPIQ
jgi:hypothetical protein